MRFRRWGTAIIGAALAMPAAAFAADLGAPEATVAVPSPAAAPASDVWTVTVGAEGRFEPSYAGSDHDIGRPYPIFDVRRAGTPERYRGPRDGIGISLLDWGNLQIGPVGQLRFRRREKSDPALRGLGDVPWAGEVGIFAEYWWAPWLRVRSETRQGVGGHQGITSDLFIDAVVPVTGQLTVSAGPRATFASTRAISPYFSINTIQSLNSGLPVFNAKGGLYSAGAGAQARYHWTPEWATHAFVEYERLSGDVAHSPLVVQRGSANQVTLGVGVTRSFDISAFW